MSRMKPAEFFRRLREAFAAGRNRRTVLIIRLSLVCAAFVAGFILIGAKLYDMQGHDFEYYQGKVADQLTSVSSVGAKRGSIYSAGGELLAADVSTVRIFIEPQAIIDAMKDAEKSVSEAEKKVEDARAALREARLDPKAEKRSGKKKIAEAEAALESAEKKLTQAENDPKREAARLVAEGLSELCGVEYDEIIALAAKTGSRDETILEHADRDLAQRVIDYRTEKGLSGLIFTEQNSIRKYFYGSLCSHAVGFTGGEGYGLYGLEYQYNTLLSGTDGRYVIARDSLGREISYDYSNYIPPEDGCDIHTTIDIRVQSVLEEQLKKTYYETKSLEGACGIVMNVKTGAVYAMATYPDFDCNDAWTLSEEYQKKLDSEYSDKESEEYRLARAGLLEKMWSNMAVSYTYIPGSTFKTITAAIALDTGTVKLTDTYRCVASIHVEDRVVHCSNIYGHGLLTFAEGLQQSCNPWFVKVGVEIGSSTFYDYVENFGYFSKSGIDLPGEGGTVFWSREGFTKINLAMCAFGQNFKVSPIRHLASIASLANGGYLVEPYIVESVTDSTGKTVMKHEDRTVRQTGGESVASTVATILADGVAGNGGSKNAYVAGFRVAAKTGTSEKIGEEDEDMRICSCVAFAPSDDPEIAIIIIVDAPSAFKTPYGSTVAAPYVSNALSEILPYFNISPVYTDAEQKKLSVSVPDCTGRISSDAQALIEKSGLACKVKGVGTVVSAQVPAAGTALSKDGGTVYLYLGDSAPENNIIIPDLVVMSAAAAKNLVAGRGLNLAIQGTSNYDTGSGAIVFDQQPAAGSRATAGDTVTLTFRYMNLADG
ncbi:MAG: PASTA domain-containing protein [Clostridiales bacterium]|nr:PASTA domain-containing protein [Clostridiales bacterium]